MIGAGRQILDFATMGDRLYMAAEEAGLFVSDDSGDNWAHIFVDSTDTDPSNRRNVVHALNVLGDTLRVGTDSGFVSLFMDPIGLIDSTRSYVFLETDSSSTLLMKKWT